MTRLITDDLCLFYSLVQIDTDGEAIAAVIVAHKQLPLFFRQQHPLESHGDTSF